MPSGADGEAAARLRGGEDAVDESGRTGARGLDESPSTEPVGPVAVERAVAQRGVGDERVDAAAVLAGVVVVEDVPEDVRVVRDEIEVAETDPRA